VEEVENNLVVGNVALDYLSACVPAHGAVAGLRMNLPYSLRSLPPALKIRQAVTLEVCALSRMPESLLDLDRAVIERLALLRRQAEVGKS
jgi:hypothetical protein